MLGQVFHTFNDEDDASLPGFNESLEQNFRISILLDVARELIGDAQFAQVASIFILLWNDRRCFLVRLAALTCRARTAFYELKFLDVLASEGGFGCDF